MNLKFFKQHIKNLLKPHKYPEPEHLENTLKKFESYSLESVAISPTDRDSLIKAIYKTWQEKQEIGLREFVTYKIKLKIPYLLFHKIEQYDRIVENEKLLTVLLSILNPPSPTVLRAIIKVYLINYDPELQGNEYLRNFIVQNLSAYSGKNSSLKYWKERINFFFTPYAVINTARWIMSQSKKVENSLQELKLDGPFAKSNFLKYVILHMIDHIDISERPLEKLFNIMKIGGKSIRFPELMPHLADQIIPKVKNYANSKIRNQVLEFFLDALGDPRDYLKMINWHGFSKNIVDDFKNLLIPKDIRIFFDIVSETTKDTTWKYRKEFWEAFLPYIEKTWILLGSEAAKIARDKNVKSAFGRLKGGEKRQSAFLLKMKGYIFIEWSHDGACRIYREDNFPSNFDAREIFKAEELRKEIIPDQLPVKIYHISSATYSWQWRLIQWIEANLQLRPENRYYSKVRGIRNTWRNW